MREYKKVENTDGAFGSDSGSDLCGSSGAFQEEKKKQKEEDTLKVGISIYQSDDTYVNLLTKK